MVCQAASQTRFRALKHENGFEGCATIIVSVIACFHTLQDCQGHSRTRMERDSGFGHHHHHPYLMSPNPSFYGFSIGTGHLYTQPVCEHPHFFEESALRNAHMFPSSGLQQPNTEGQNRPQNRLYDMPNFRNAFHPVRKNSYSTMGLTHLQKKFIIFDQSCDKTMLIYRSWAHDPVQLGAYWLPNPPTPCNMIKEELRVISNPLQPSTDNENIDYNSRDFTEDEMHEDTEEINALLFSDSDFSQDDDDDETSTGHSPNTMTDNAVRDSVGETGQEVDSFGGPAPKRRRISISDGCYKNVGPALEDDSVCGDGVRYDRRKRLSREKVHETLRALQSVIPNAKGKDSIAVIDEAIDYLRSLKMKVKALGLDAL
ncbi:hypothetical protein OROGR_029485 [Orobanche gracilis]